MTTYLDDDLYLWCYSKNTSNKVQSSQPFGPFYVEIVIEKGDLEDSQNVQIALDNINNDILQLQTDISNIESEEISKFRDFRDSKRITYRMGNKLMNQTLEDILQQ
jgi:hypothetical protein